MSDKGNERNVTDDSDAGWRTVGKAKSGNRSRGKPCDQRPQQQHCESVGTTTTTWTKGQERREDRGRGTQDDRGRGRGSWRRGSSTVQSFQSGQPKEPYHRKQEQPRGSSMVHSFEVGQSREPYHRKLEQRLGSSMVQSEQPREPYHRTLDQRQAPPRSPPPLMEFNGGSHRGGRGMRGGSYGRGHRGGGAQRGDHRGGRSSAMMSEGRADGEMQMANSKSHNQAWNFWTLLCGSVDSQVVFTEYKGYCTNRSQRTNMDRGWIKVPLFQMASDEEICERFRATLQSIASSVAECEELRNDRCRLMVHLRIGDLYLFHKQFRFDCRPGPRLEDFNLLLEDRSFSEAREKMSRFFIDEDFMRPSRQTTVKSTFVTEKFCGSHATIEAFLSMRDFEASPDQEFVISTTLNGDKQKFESYYRLSDLQLHNIQVSTHKWNLNLVTAKGTNYQGTFKETADFRLQFESAFDSKTEKTVRDCLSDNGFNPDSLQQLFDRVGDDPSAQASDDSNAFTVLSDNSSERVYKLRVPELASKMSYVREQHNRTFVRPHDRWPLSVQLRKFKFYKPAEDSTYTFVGQSDVEFRVTAKLEGQLNSEVLEEPEFVSHMWECCQLMQDMVAVSLET